MAHRVLIESSTDVRRLYASVRGTVVCRPAIGLIRCSNRWREMNELASYVNSICFSGMAQCGDIENPPITAGVLPAILLLLQVESNSLVIKEAKVLVQELQTCVVFRYFVSELAGNFTSLGE